ncbi:MAG: dihydrodipicolinate reductase C-terminal domain-containing protein [Flavobacteriales bacterium]|nr:dihydrodipicolinate reductase C-terminal domain-containing protein [Flavobacteriales bacterium]
MRIALLGYGKMGRLIEKIALERSHSIVARIDSHSTFDLNGADVAIDFSAPSCAFYHIENTVKAGIPIVCGTTGWNDKWDEAVKLIEQNEGAMIYSSNFSLGVNVFFRLNEFLAKMLKPYPQYTPSITETHHIHKKDAPSGTAITLSEGIGKNIEIKSIREGEVPGTHSVSYDSEIDSIEICHTAHSRDGFALGAVLAAEWVIGKKGIFSMQDVIFKD